LHIGIIIITEHADKFQPSLPVQSELVETLTRSSATVEIARVVPQKPYIAKNWTSWVTFFVAGRLWIAGRFSEFDAVGSESCRIV